MTRPVTVVFLCRRNSGRSQMAAAYLKAVLGDAVDVRSGGTEPAQQIDANVLRVMAEDGVSLDRAKPASFDRDAVAAADRVIAMGCAIGDVDLPRVDEDWGIEDVDGLEIDAVRAIRDGVKRRVLGLAGEIRRGTLGARADAVAAGAGK